MGRKEELEQELEDLEQEYIKLYNTLRAVVVQIGAIHEYLEKLDEQS